MNMNKHWKKLALLAVLSLVLLAAGCGSEETAGSSFKHITGIEPSSGVVAAAEKAIVEYDLDIEVLPSSSAGMAAELKRAIDNEEWIVVTGWTPHWMFAAHDLKYLEDPKGVFGGAESIHTITRVGFEADFPVANQVLDTFNWTPDDMNKVMLDIAENGMSETEAAQAWIDSNRSSVDSWIDGVEAVDGKDITLVYVPWDSEIASTHVIGLVLEELGFNVELTPLENDIMWQAIANGDGDAMVAAWLPGTHASQYESHDGNYVDLGANLEGAKIGLVVPTYVNIDSIADIK
jgi:glycine betaine/proline transport system substrate-binding protein